jgi:hypothetical protein
MRLASRERHTFCSPFIGLCSSLVPYQVELRGSEPGSLACHRTQPVADRSHMLPDQPLRSPQIARRRLPSPVVCSPLAPARAIFSCSSPKSAISFSVPPSAATKRFSTSCVHTSPPSICDTRAADTPIRSATCSCVIRRSERLRAAGRLRRAPPGRWLPPLRHPAHRPTSHSRPWRVPCGPGQRALVFRARAHAQARALAGESASPARERCTGAAATCVMPAAGPAAGPTRTGACGDAVRWSRPQGGPSRRFARPKSCGHWRRRIVRRPPPANRAAPPACPAPGSTSRG